MVADKYLLEEIVASQLSGCVFDIGGGSVLAVGGNERHVARVMKIAAASPDIVIAAIAEVGRLREMVSTALNYPSALGSREKAQVTLAAKMFGIDITWNRISLN